MNLILGLFWLIMAMGIFLHPIINPHAGRLTIGDTGISFAWVAVFFAVYNLVRWFIIRLGKHARKTMDQPPGRSQRPPEKRHPEFDFSNEENHSEPEA